MAREKRPGTRFVKGVSRGGIDATIDAATTLLAADAGKVFLIATDGIDITLPPTEIGLEFTFINSGAAGNNTIQIVPNASDAIFGTISSSTGDQELSGTDAARVTLTKSGNIKGDMVRIIADGDAGWYVTSGHGVWTTT